MKQENIRQLIDKYMAGDTSNEEEALLRRWFGDASHEIPEAWKPLKALFGYIDRERAELRDIGVRRNAGQDTVTALKHRRLFYLVGAAAAAAVLLVVGVGQIVRPQPLFYAVIDGKVYTDRNVVKSEALDALQDVSAGQKDAFGALDMMK